MTRSRWTSNTVFIFAAVGSMVGLGNVWRFPYLAGKYGGGAFLAPYLIALFVIGLPLLILEFAIGQKMQQGAVGTYRKLHKGFAGLGVFALLSAFIIASYYAVVMAWSLIYLKASTAVSWTGDAKGYFLNNVLEISESVGVIGGINWNVLIALALVWIMIYFCVWKGTKSVGKVVMLTVPLPIILLGVLFVRAVTLPGFMDGWTMYLTPVWGALLDVDVWVAACAQIFFTIGIGFGMMIAYASYKKQNADIARDAWITALINSAISLFSGFVVFGILGYMASNTGTPIAELAAEGPGLAFIVFPEALSLMPVAWFFSIVFFITLLSLGIDSAFSLAEAVNISILDYLKMSSKKISFYVCAAGFLAGIIFTTRAGLYFLDIIDHFVTNYNLILVGLIQTILVGWLYGAEKLRDYINDVSHWQIGKWWDISIKFVVPILLLVLLGVQFYKDLTVPYEGYPMWALYTGWAVIVVPLFIFIILIIKDTTAKASE
ncbi:sodium-dependent transporter [Nanoarchaeota archaeon]